MSGGEVPIVVCVSSDVAVRERVVRRMDGVGPVLTCADLAELRALLFAPPLPPMPVPIPTVAVPSGSERPVSWDHLVVDQAGHLVTWRGVPLALTRIERELLARLASAPVTLWSYERLFASVWGGAYLGDTAILHSAVKRLRHKLRILPGAPRVQTVRGVGYRLLPTPPDESVGRPPGGA